MFLINRFAIAAIISALLGLATWYVHRAGYEAGVRQVRQMWDQDKARQAQAQADELLRARARESALQALANKLRKEKADEAQRLAREYTADLERLRNRPEGRAGAGGLPSAPGLGVGSTGEGLARPDAQFLVWFAAEAGRLQAAYDECRIKYQALKE